MSFPDARETRRLMTQHRRARKAEMILRKQRGRTIATKREVQADMRFTSKTISYIHQLMDDERARHHAAMIELAALLSEAHIDHAVTASEYEAFINAKAMS